MPEAQCVRKICATLRTVLDGVGKDRGSGNDHHPAGRSCKQAEEELCLENLGMRDGFVMGLVFRLGSGMMPLYFFVKEQLVDGGAAPEACVDGLCPESTVDDFLARLSKLYPDRFGHHNFVYQGQPLWRLDCQQLRGYQAQRARSTPCGLRRRLTH